MWKQRAQASYKSTDSLIGYGDSLEGKVQCDTNLRIDGDFSGEIQCRGTVTVGEQGTVHSSIKAHDIVIAGKVFGSVTADHKLTITDTGQLHGDIMAGILNIVEGSVLNCSVAMAELPAAEKAGGPTQNVKKDKDGKRRSKAQKSTLEAG
ncbi:cell division protein [Paenibacillus sp. PK3_47]|uniref:bactofilin family protein n=1 Tax=Paenibacillus sp. PK3_47 TaxID=2072642 RepID=UPI00201E099E|nr:polymer-forming cytoskeletal protein [Paenibacillus sp. PK3_47]UQZ35077.1 cell division protein [Paenibacillus sp. PK3_47]